MLSKTGLRSFRILVGISALVAGFSVPYITSNGALDWSVLVFGGLVLLHIGVDMVWDLLSGTNAGANPGDASSGQVYTITAVPGEPKPNVTAPTSPSAAAGEKSPTDATVQLVIALITTAGVVLAVIQAFTASVGLAAKVGAVSLAVAAMMGFVLFGLVADKAPLPTDRAWHFRGYVFNLTLWGISFGMLCVAFSFVFSGAPAISPKP